MKVSELLEAKIPYKITDRGINDVSLNKRLRHIGTGIQAIAYEYKRHPNAVVKAIQIYGEKDPIVAFLRICMNHSTNPFFPKIYSFKVFKNSDLSEEERHMLYRKIDTDYDIDPPYQRQYVLVIVMEKLQSLHATKNRHISIQLLKQLGITFDETSDLLYGMRDMFDTKQGRRELVKKSTNPQFIKAMRLLEPILNKSDPDFHSDNVMLRTTGSIPQLVFVDPVVEW